MKNYFYIAVLATILIFTSCSKDDVKPVEPTATQVVQTLNLYKTYYSQKVYYKNGLIIQTDAWLKIEKETLVYSTNPTDEGKEVPQTKYTTIQQDTSTGNISGGIITSFKAVLER
jgi:hypothetical protein